MGETKVIDFLHLIYSKLEALEKVEGIAKQFYSDGYQRKLDRAELKNRIKEQNVAIWEIRQRVVHMSDILNTQTHIIEQLREEVFKLREEVYQKTVQLRKVIEKMECRDW